MSVKLTDRQKEIFGFVTSCMDEKKYVPTIKQISEHFQFTTKAARDHIQAIVDKGHLDPSIFKSKVLEVRGDSPKVYPNTLLKDIVHAPSIVNVNRDVVEIPIYSYVSVTPPYLHVKAIQWILPLPVSAIQFFKDHCFGYPCRDETMIGAGIIPGDIMICRLNDEAKPGSIAIVSVNKRAIMRRIFENGDNVILMADNAALEPQYFNKECIDVIGHYIGLWRPGFMMAS